VGFTERRESRHAEHDLWITTPWSSQIMGSETSPMSKAAIEKSVRLIWVVGNCIWCSLVLVLWWRKYEAQTLMVSGFGACWSYVGGAWLAKLRKTKET
jgi:hypothetical protein